MGIEMLKKMKKKSETRIVNVSILSNIKLRIPEIQDKAVVTILIVTVALVVIALLKYILSP